MFLEASLPLLDADAETDSKKIAERQKNSGSKLANDLIFTAGGGEEKRL